MNEDEKIRQRLLQRIQAIPGWEGNSFWKSLYNYVFVHGRLSDLQMGRLEGEEIKRGILKTSPKYRQFWVKAIKDAPGYGADPFLGEMLKALQRGQVINGERVTQAIQFRRDLRERWLDRLRNIAREFKVDPAIFSVVVDIGRRLKDSMEAHPTREDMEILESMLPPQWARDLINMSRSRSRMATRVAEWYLAQR